MTPWTYVGVMPCCGHVVWGYPDRGPFYARLCGVCGATREAVIGVARWVSTSVWWRPSTWGQGHFEFADEYDRQQAIEAGLKLPNTGPDAKEGSNG